MSGSMYFNSPYILQEKTGYLFLFYSQPGILLHLCLDYLVYIRGLLRIQSQCVSTIILHSVFRQFYLILFLIQTGRPKRPSSILTGTNPVNMSRACHFRRRLFRPCNRSLDQQIVSGLHVTDSS